MPQPVRCSQETASANPSRCRRRHGPALPETPHSPDLGFAAAPAKVRSYLSRLRSSRPYGDSRTGRLVTGALALRRRSGAPLARQRSSSSPARPDAARPSTAAGHPTIRARRRRSTDRCARRPRPWPVAIRNAEPARARARLPKVPELRATSRDASSYPHYRDHTVTRASPTIVSTSDAQEE